jgi:hypothetical protein
LVSDIFIHTIFRIAFYDTTTAFANESNNLIPLISSREFFFQEFQRLAGIHPFIINDAVNVQDMIDLVDSKTSSLQSHAVYT